MRLMTRPRKTPAPDLMPVLGYVVAMAKNGNAPYHLTRADLMSREEAEHEVREWRQHARDRGNRLVICSVVEDWGLRVLAAMEDDDDE